GLLEITQAGTYNFRITSDDGTRLWINGTELITHDGARGVDPPSDIKSVYLNPGRHTIKVKYIEIAGNEVLEVRYSGPGIPDLVLIPDDVLCNYPVLTPPTAPVNLQASNESMTSIKLQWGHNDSDAYGYELYRGKSEDSNFELVGTTGLSIKEFTDTGLNPSTVYFYKVKAIGAEGGSEYSNVIYTSTLEDIESPYKIEDLEKIKHG